MTNKRPADYVNLSGLAVNVSHNWGTRFSTYEVKFANHADFSIEATNFRDKALENAMQDTTQSGQNNALKICNLKIDDGVKVMKKYFQAEFPLEKNLAVHYIAYGLELNNNGGYSFIKDNERRGQRMAILIAKLSEPNNPFALKPYGLQYWLDVQAEHTAAWANSKEGKGDKTALSRETRAYFDSVNETLRKLSAQIKIDFPKI
ncbi:MAG: hypothetical protein RI894_1411, partial [Bacteroidota bacterium]